MIYSTFNSPRGKGRSCDLGSRGVRVKALPCRSKRRPYSAEYRLIAGLPICIPSPTRVRFSSCNRGYSLLCRRDPLFWVEHDCSWKQADSSTYVHIGQEGWVVILRIVVTAKATPYRKATPGVVHWWKHEVLGQFPPTCRKKVELFLYTSK